MSLGKMRHRIELQTRETASDGAGGVSSQWSTVRTVWASIDPQRASEGLNSDKIQTAITYNIRMRMTKLDTTYRIKYGDRILNVTQVLNPFERDKYLEVVAVEGVAV